MLQSGILPLIIVVSYLSSIFMQADMQADICSALHVHHAYFKFFLRILYTSIIAGQLKVSMQLNTCISFQYKDIPVY